MYCSVYFQMVKCVSSKSYKFLTYSGEPAISLHSYTVSLVQSVTCLLPVMRDRGSIPRGYLSETVILLLALSRYISDPYMIDHCGLVWGGLCPEPSLGHHNVIIPLDLLSQFHARCRSSFRRHSHIVGCWWGAPWRACNLTAFIHSLTGPVGHPFASHHEGPGFNPRGVLVWNRDSTVNVVSLQCSNFYH
jgi:hypothetical protein